MQSKSGGSRRLCNFFNTPKGCWKGSGCPFLHDASSAQTNAGASAGNSGRRVCGYFNTPNGCHKGSKCPFIHDATLPARAQPRRKAFPPGSPGFSLALFQGMARRDPALMTTKDYGQLLVSVLNCLEDSSSADIVLEALGGNPGDQTDGVKVHFKGIASTWAKWSAPDKDQSQAEKVSTLSPCTTHAVVLLLCMVF